MGYSAECFCWTSDSDTTYTCIVEGKVYVLFILCLDKTFSLSSANQEPWVIREIQGGATSNKQDLSFPYKPGVAKLWPFQMQNQMQFMLDQIVCHWFYS